MNLESNPKNDYYVYTYVDERGEPYYIGKGRGRRAWAVASHPRVPGRNQICILCDGMTEGAALQMERTLIEYYYNQLQNSAGNYIGGKTRVPSEITRQRMSDAHKGKQYSLGHKRTPDNKRKIAEGMRGKQNTLGKTWKWKKNEP